MATDVKLAILAGVGLISAFALVCYKKDMSARKLIGESETAAYTSFPGGNRGLNRAQQFLPTPAFGGGSDRRAASSSKGGYHYRLHQGDTLAGLANRFYGDGDRFIDILNANRSLISSPDHLPAGTEIVIPGVDNRGRMLADSGNR
jgi:nucleoid-associated protein YgaU